MKKTRISFLVWLCFFGVFNYLLAPVNGKGEFINPLIPVAKPSAQCVASANARPCPQTYALAKLDAKHMPDSSACPCVADGGPGGAIQGASGTASAINPDAGSFVDEILVGGLINPVGFAFTDSDELYVAGREGVIWHVDVKTGAKNVFIDLSAEVGMSGDRGMMGIDTFPNFANQRKIVLAYTVDPNLTDGVEPDAESAANQRVIVVEDVGGVFKPNSRVDILGGGDNDGPPICFNTHAISSVKFGLDGSLIISVGEGSHWNFDWGDWGQNSQFSIGVGGVQRPSLDDECTAKFGPDQDVGAWRSQVLNSLSGKILRIDPGTGKGICGPNSGYQVNNPFCNIANNDPNAVSSKIWALGARNPFRMNIRPLRPGEAYNGGPGTIYFGDVGQGGYEELNAVISPGQNFGWPCWEGPMPSPIYRDSPYNDDPTLILNTGCSGPCKAITTIARAPDGARLTCPYIYQNVTTTLPYFFWSRFHINDNAGYFTENAYLGQGFYGATAAGVAFYTGTSYPARYQGATFILDFSMNWIRVLYSQDNNPDTYSHVQDFADLIFTPPVDGAKVSLEINKNNGNLCYLTMNGGEVRCFRYVVSNVPPVPAGRADPDAGIAPFVTQLSMDGTQDREGDDIAFQWVIGGTVITDVANPTLNVQGPTTVMLVTTDKFGHSANTTLSVTSTGKRPTVTITSPVPNAVSGLVEFLDTDLLTFSATSDIGPVTLTWEFQIVHNNHIHTNMLTRTGNNFVLAGGVLPFEGGGARNNVRLICTATTASGLTGTSVLRLAKSGWQQLFPNTPPIPGFSATGAMRALQPVLLDATATVDNELDRIDYSWDFGDGFSGVGVTTTHFYNLPGNFQITLTTSDNWNARTILTKQVTIAPNSAISPVVSPTAGQVFAAINVTFQSIQPAQIRYTTDGSDPIPTSPLAAGKVPLPFSPNIDVTIKARAFLPPLAPSPVVTNTYQFRYPPCTSLGIDPQCGLVCVNTLSLSSQLSLSSSTPIPAKTPLTAQYTSDVPRVNNFENYFLVKRFLAENLSGKYNAQKQFTRLNLYADAGKVPAQTLKAKVSYDLDNNGVWDHVEIFQLMAFDDVANTYELYRFDVFATAFPDALNQFSGKFGDLVSGVVMLEVWQPLGSSAVNLLSGGANGVGQMSMIEIPFDNVIQTAPSTCGQNCSGGIVSDVCGTCGGTGLGGCDKTCYSVSVVDSCGTCGGPGPTGCDKTCFSTKTVDSCGVCGGNGGCKIPVGEYPCSSLNVLGLCNELVCGSLNLNTAPTQILIPIQPSLVPVFDVKPAAQYVLTLQKKNITGFYNSDLQYSSVTLVLDSGIVGGQLIAAVLSYDFTGDGIFDRIERLNGFPPNDVTGFEAITRIGSPTELLNPAPAPFQNLVHGTIQLEIWVGVSKQAQVVLKTDLAQPTTVINIPYVTASGPNTNQNCNPVEIPVTGIVFTTVTTGTGGTTGGGVPPSTTTSRPPPAPGANNGNQNQANGVVGYRVPSFVVYLLAFVVLGLM